MLPRQYDLFEFTSIPPDTQLNSNLAATLELFTREDLLHPVALEYIYSRGRLFSATIAGLFGWSTSPIFATYWDKLDRQDQDWTTSKVISWKDFYLTPAIREKYQTFISSREYPSIKADILRVKSCIPWNILERLQLKHNIKYNALLQHLSMRQEHEDTPIDYDNFFRWNGFSGVEGFITRYNEQQEVQT